MFSPSPLLSDKALLNILSESPVATAVYTGEQLYIAFANAAMCKLWGIAGDVTGKTYVEIRRGSTQTLANDILKV